MTKLAFRTSRGCLTRGNFPAVLLRCMVQQNVPDLTDREYTAGLEIALEFLMKREEEN